MSGWGELRRRLGMLVNWRQFDADLEEEMRLHLELRQQEQLESGRTADEARAAAQRHFGNITYLKEESRLAWGWQWLENLGQDARYGFRMLRKSPGFTATVVLTMALGIGATTAIFSVVDATLIHPLPYAQPEQLVSIQDDLTGVGARDVGMNQPEWEDLKHSGIFEYVAPTWFDENDLTGSDRPARVRIMIVAPNYFALLGVNPQMGRIFNPEDHSPGLLPEVLISDGLWKREFGGDPHILEKSVRFDTDLYRIVGVMPPGFDAPGRTAEERNIDAWAATSFYGGPMTMHPPRSRRNLPTAIARLKPGLTIAQAQSRVDALIAALEKQFPEDYPQRDAWRVRLVPLQEKLVGSIRQSLILLLGAVGLVLVIGCVNVANLLLARASTRGREMAVRQALGATRKRLIAQWFAESLLLSLAGAMAGLAILFSLKGFLLERLPSSVPHLNQASITGPVLVFALLASLATATIFGLAPAFDAGRLDLVHRLKEATRGSAGSREQTSTRRLLVITEFALALVLMIAAGLLLRSFWDLLHVRLGFRPENVLSVRTRLPYPNDPKTDLYKTPAQETPFLRELVRRARTLPGVKEVALGDPGSIPLNQSQHQLKLISDGQLLVRFEDGLESEPPTVVERSGVTSDYFGLMGIPLLRGRLFNSTDDDEAPQVAVINEAFAETYWPNQDPLGKRFRSTRANSPWITVVGLTANARTDSLAEAGVPQVYLNLFQSGSHHLAMFLRGHFDTAAIAEEVRQQVQSVDPTLPVFGAQTLKEAVSSSLAERRFSMETIALFAVTAFLLAGLGIYGVISYMVSERTQEIGVRLALGAKKENILGLVLRQGLALATAGAAVGLVGALIVSHLMAGLLYGVRATDPLTFAGVALLLLGVAALACYVPARRAIRVDPMIALRYE